MKDKREEELASIKKEASHVGEYFVCKGAKCKCDASVEGTLVDLIILQEKYLVNEDKPIATIRDIQFALPFGSCKNLPYNPPCPYVPSKPWDVGEGLPLIDGNDALPEKATLTCPNGGTITIEIHGQKIEVEESSSEEVDDSIAAAISPQTPADTEEEKEEEKKKTLLTYGSVKSITLNKNSLCENDLKSENTRLSAKKEIPVLIDNEYIFTADTAKSEGDGTKWLVFHPDKKVNKDVLIRKNAAQDYNGILYEDETLISGQSLKLKFKNTGLYYIESFGGKNTGNISSNCTLLVNAYASNELINIKKKYDESENNVINETELVLKRRTIYTFKLDFLFPLTEEEKKSLRVEITDKNGFTLLVSEIEGLQVDKNGQIELKVNYRNEKLKPLIYKGRTEFLYAPINLGKHIMKIYWKSSLVKLFMIDVLTTDSIDVRPNIELDGQRVRPNTRLEFIAISDDKEIDAVWIINGNKIKGKSKNYSLAYPRSPGEYTIEAKLTSFLIKKIKGFYKLTVIENHVIEVNYSTQNADIGEKVIISYITAYELNGDEKIVVTIAGDKITNNNHETGTYKFSLNTDKNEAYIIFFKEGAYKVDFSIYKNNKYIRTGKGAPSVEINVKKISIKKWNFINSEGKAISLEKNIIGWGHDFGIHIEIDCNKPNSCEFIILRIYAEKEGELSKLISHSIPVEKFNKHIRLENIGNSFFWEKAEKIGAPLSFCFSLDTDPWITDVNLNINDIFNNAKRLSRVFGEMYLCFENDVFIKTPEKAFFTGSFINDKGQQAYDIISYEDTVKVKIKLFAGKAREFINTKFVYELIENKIDGLFCSKDASIYTEEVVFDENFVFEKEVLIDAIKGSKSQHQKKHIPRFFYFALKKQAKSFIGYSRENIFFYPYNANKNDKFILEFYTENTKLDNVQSITNKINNSKAKINKLKIEIEKLLKDAQDKVGIYTNVYNMWISINSFSVKDTSLPENIKEKFIEWYSANNELNSLYAQLSKAKEEEVIADKNEQKISSLGEVGVQRYYYQQLKIAEEPEIQNSVAKRVGAKVGGPMEGVMGKYANIECPRCKAAIRGTANEIKSQHETCLKNIFPNASDSVLKTVADAYTKYMSSLKMDTCWQKAHFFAQAAIETGYKLEVNEGENMDYTETQMYSIFPSKFFKGSYVNGVWVSVINKNAKYKYTDDREFKDKEHYEKAGKLRAITDKTERKKAIANFVYANTNGNGNEASGEGWRFRGSGLVQITGKGIFKEVKNKISHVWSEDILTEEGANKVRTNLELAVLTSMGYFLYKVNESANGCDKAEKICKLVGNDIVEDKVSKNHQPKIDFFNNKSSKLFNTDECQWGKIKIFKTPPTYTNEYYIDIETRTVEVGKQEPDSKNAFIYIVFYQEIEYVRYSMPISTNPEQVLFDDSGTGFGRCGILDVDGDHYLKPLCAAYLLGLVTEMYINEGDTFRVDFNDMSNKYGKDPGGHHQTHGGVNGHSGTCIDYRYLGKDKKSFQGKTGSSKFCVELNFRFLKCSKAWKFTQNYLSNVHKWKLSSGENIDDYGKRINDHDDHGHLTFIEK